MSGTLDITWDIEATGLLNNDSIDYNASPYKIKDSFNIHCIVVEEHSSGTIHAFYNGDTIFLDGREYYDSYDGYECNLLEYKPTDYIHHQLTDFKSWISTNKIRRVVAHNQINYDLLAAKLKLEMDYTIQPDTWCGKSVKIIDTMILSKTLNPDVYGGHSLDNLGSRCGLKKIEFRKHIPVEYRFKHFSADMLYYCIVDVTTNTGVFKYLCAQMKDWDWSDSFSLESSVADIITRQEHRGFHFDRELAVRNVQWLDLELDRLSKLVEPILPAKPLPKTKLAWFTPSKTQFLKNGEPSHHIKGFVEKHGGHWVGEFKCVIFDKEWTLPIPTEPLVTHTPMQLKDSTEIKGWLVSEFGWNPQQYKERDLTVNTKKVKLNEDDYVLAVKRYVLQTLNSPFKADRLEHLECSAMTLESKLLRADRSRPVKVYTNPTYTVGQEKETCPDLIRISEQFPFARDVVNYLTYKHRRSSILGGDFDPDDDEDEINKGFLAYIRDDGRIPTPAATCDASTARMKHRLVANIPRVTSTFGDKMRSMFGVTQDFVQIGYDFNSLEAMIEAHFVYPFEGGIEYGISLTAEKPNDCHSRLAAYISELIGEKFSRGSAKNVKYGCSYNAQAKRVAKTIGKPLHIGQIVFDAFWSKAAPLKAFKESVQNEWKHLGQQKFIKGLDGRKIPIRSKGNCVNSAFQSAGVICAKRAAVIHENKLREKGLIVDFFKDDWKSKLLFQQMIMYHDEAQGEVSKELVKVKTFRVREYTEETFTIDGETKTDKELAFDEAEQMARLFKSTRPDWSDIGKTDNCVYVGYCEAGKLAQDAVREAGEYYNLNIKLSAGYNLGRNWAQCH